MIDSRLQEQLAFLPDYLSSHFLLSVGALVIGIAISLPLACIVIRYDRLAGPVLGVASVVQTIPGLALLALMVPLLGRIGVAPALMALVLYSVLPVLRNTVTGAAEVDPNVIEAARGIGMTEGQILRQVQLPLATPVIVAGIRTASVWTVGTATLSTPVGATSLGNYIFSGLQTQNMTAVLVGCVAAAGLAIGLDALIRIGEVAARRRDTRLAIASGIALLAALVLALLPQLGSIRGASDRPLVRVGAKTFTEQYILARVLANQLEQAGFDVQLRDGLGSTVVFDALVNDDIDLYVDYSGTIWANHMKREDTPDSARVLDEMASWLRGERGVESLGPLGFENAYALAMRRDRAEALGIRDLGDLAKQSRALGIGGDYEFFARPEWQKVSEQYLFEFAEQRSFDSSLMYAAVVDGHVDVISAFSSDGRIAAFDLLVLEDPHQALPPYDAVLLATRRASEDPRIRAAIAPMLGGISDGSMRRANMLVDVEGKGVADAAKFLSNELKR